jgi:hypothetical protein
LPAPLNLALVSALRELRLNSPSDTSTSYRRSAANPFRITSFADPCPLTPIESDLYKNYRGVGGAAKISSSFASFARGVIPSGARDLLFSFPVSLGRYLSNLKGNSHVR